MLFMYGRYACMYVMLSICVCYVCMLCMYDCMVRVNVLYVCYVCML